MILLHSSKVRFYRNKPFSQAIFCYIEVFQAGFVQVGPPDITYTYQGIVAMVTHSSLLRHNGHQTIETISHSFFKERTTDTSAPLVK